MRLGDDARCLQTTGEGFDIPTPNQGPTVTGHKAMPPLPWLATRTTF